MSIPEKKLAACVEVPGPPSEPLASVIRQPLSGSAPASARATCAEPPRGKNKSAESTRPRGRARSVGGRSRPAAASGLPRPACSTGAILLEREDGASAPASSYAADRVSECVAVAFWRKLDNDFQGRGRYRPTFQSVAGMGGRGPDVVGLPVADNVQRFAAMGWSDRDVVACPRGPRFQVMGRDKGASSDLKVIDDLDWLTG